MPISCAKKKKKPRHVNLNHVTSSLVGRYSIVNIAPMSPCASSRWSLSYPPPHFPVSLSSLIFLISFPCFGLWWGGEGRWKKQATFLSFFTFRHSPQKIFKFKMWPLHSPSHHKHHTSVLPTLHPTLWCWFYCDWMSLIGMISFHGYQNLSSPPTSKPSCDRYTQPPKIKPTPSSSPDDALPAHMNIGAIWAVFPIRKFFFFFFCLFFHFPKRRAKPWKREVHLLEKIFSEICRHVIAFF